MQASEMMTMMAEEMRRSMMQMMNLTHMDNMTGSDMVAMVEHHAASMMQDNMMGFVPFIQKIQKQLQEPPPSLQLAW